MNIQPLLDLCKCSGTQICPFCKLLMVAGLVIAGILSGYWFGRRGKGKPAAK